MDYLVTCTFNVKNNGDGNNYYTDTVRTTNSTDIVRITNNSATTRYTAMTINLTSMSSNWINGCTQWITDHVLEGWNPYYINIMFHPLPGSLPTLISTMHHGIRKGFYSQFCTRFARDPRSKSGQQQIPRLWLIPDRPVSKRNGKKHGCDFLTRNDNGLHFNGPMLIPPKSRFRECPIEHIEANQSKYIGHGIERIHVKKVYDNPGIADYAFKTVKWGRADPDDILILPISPSELPQKSPSSIPPYDRGIKDIQAAFNMSEEVAEEIYAHRNSHGFERRYR
jgi:hypothetical protein